MYDELDEQYESYQRIRRQRPGRHDGEDRSREPARKPLTHKQRKALHNVKHQTAELA